LRDAARDRDEEKMAEKETRGGADAAKEGAAAPRKGRGKLLIIVGVALTLLLAGGGAAAYLVLGKKNADMVQAEEDGDAGEQGQDAGADAKAGEKGKPDRAKKAKKRKHAPVFVELEMFTANLKDADEDRFIQVRLVAEMRDAPSGEMLKTMMPAVRNEVLLLLGSKESKDIATRAGKEKLADEIVAAANRTLEGTPAAGGVEGVNFTHIIVQ
jgi:flagellar FliL protein